MTKKVDFFLFIMITMATYPVLARLSSTRPWKPEEKKHNKIQNTLFKTFKSYCRNVQFSLFYMQIIVRNQIIDIINILLPIKIKEVKKKSDRKTNAFPTEIDFSLKKSFTLLINYPQKNIFIDNLKTKIKNRLNMKTTQNFQSVLTFNDFRTNICNQSSVQIKNL